MIHDATGTFISRWALGAEERSCAIFWRRWHGLSRRRHFDKIFSPAYFTQSSCLLSADIFGARWPLFYFTFFAFLGLGRAPLRRFEITFRNFPKRAMLYDCRTFADADGFYRRCAADGAHFISSLLPHTPFFTFHWWRSLIRIAAAAATDYHCSKILDMYDIACRHTSYRYRRFMLRRAWLDAPPPPDAEIAMRASKDGCDGEGWWMLSSASPA